MKRYNVRVRLISGHATVLSIEAPHPQAARQQARERDGVAEVIGRTGQPTVERYMELFGYDVTDAET